MVVAVYTYKDGGYNVMEKLIIGIYACTKICLCTDEHADNVVQNVVHFLVSLIMFMCTRAR